VCLYEAIGEEGRPCWRQILAVGAIGAGVGAAAGVASVRGLEPSRHSAPIDLSSDHRPSRLL